MTLNCLEGETTMQGELNGIKVKTLAEAKRRQQALKDATGRDIRIFKTGKSFFVGTELQWLNMR